jgi:hypothetical protein
MLNRGEPLSWKLLHLERPLLPGRVSPFVPLDSMQRPHLCLRRFSTLSWPLSPFFLLLMQFTLPSGLYIVTISSRPTYTLLPGGRIECCIGRASMEESAGPCQASAIRPFVSTSLSTDKLPQSSPSVMIPEIPVVGESSAGVCLLFIASKSYISDFIFLTASWIC